MITCAQVTAEGSGRIASGLEGQPAAASSTISSQFLASSGGHPSRVTGQPLTHQFEPPRYGSTPRPQTFAEAADAAVAAVEADSP